MTPFRYSFLLLLVSTISFAAIHQNPFASKASAHNLPDTVPSAVSDTLVFEKPEVEASVDMVKWRNHLQKTLTKLIEKVAKKGIPDGEYTVLARFLVEKDGALTDIKVLNDPGYGVGKEMEKIIKTAPKWTPGTVDGRVVRSYHTQPVTFIISTK